MHEFSITEGILKLALEKAAGADAKKITRINLVIGDLSGIVDECVRFYFDFMAKDTIAAGTDINIQRKPVQAQCRSCKAVYQPQDGNWACPECQKTAVDVISGRECYMESLEVE